jgi:hypothetical protein
MHNIHIGYFQEYFLKNVGAKYMDFDKGDMGLM